MGSCSQPSPARRRKGWTVGAGPQVQKSVPSQLRWGLRVANSVLFAVGAGLQVQKSAPSPVVGVPRVQNSVPSQVAAHLEVQNSLPSPVVGVPRVQKSAPSQVAAHPEVQNSVPSPVVGVARVQKSAPSQIAARLEVQNSVPSQVVGVPRVQNSVPSERRPVPGGDPKQNAQPISRLGVLLFCQLVQPPAPTQEPSASHIWPMGQACVASQSWKQTPRPMRSKQRAPVGQPPVVM